MDADGQHRGEFVVVGPQGCLGWLSAWRRLSVSAGSILAILFCDGLWGDPNTGHRLWSVELRSFIVRDETQRKHKETLGKLWGMAMAVTEAIYIHNSFSEPYILYYSMDK